MFYQYYIVANTDSGIVSYSVYMTYLCPGKTQYTYSIFGKEIEITVVDINNDGELTVDDASYLLDIILFGETYYPIYCQDCDFDASGSVDSDDAIYLLYHIHYGSKLYPII